MPATRHSRARALEPYKSRQPSDPCPICSKVLSRASDMVRHMKIHDPNAELYHCYGEGCQFYTKHKTNLYDHYRACGLRPPLECEYCPALFTQSASRQRHCEDKHGYKPTTRRKTPQDAVKKEVKPRPKPTFRIIQQNAGSWEDVSPNYSTFQLSAADSSSMSSSEYSELSDSNPETTTSIATPVFSMLSPQISLPSDVIYGKECFQASSTLAEWEANASQLDSFDSCMASPQHFVYTSSKGIAPEFTTPYMSQITPGYNAAFGINAQEDFQAPYHLSISNVAGDGFYSSNTDPLLSSGTFSYMPVSVSGSSFNGDSNLILNEFPELVTTLPQSTSNYLSVDTYQYQPTTTSSLGMQDSSSNLASLDYFEGIWSDECLYSACIPAV